MDAVYTKYDIFNQDIANLLNFSGRKVDMAFNHYIRKTCHGICFSVVK